MKIIHLLQSPVFSGAENVVCQIMKMFSNTSDIQMIYVSPRGPIQETIESKGFSYIGIDGLSLGNVRKIIKEEKPDIIHAHDISASIIACLSAIGSNVQVISHVHVNNADMSKMNKKTFLYYLSAYRYKHIFWVSPSCFDSYYFNKQLKYKSTVLNNVMDKEDIIFRAQQVTNPKQYDLIYVGRIVYQKHPERLLRVLADIVKRMPSIKVGIVGNGDLLEQTRAQATSLGLDENIEFLGYLSNPLGVLSKSKVMIMTSRYEGLPMTVLEALALGVPVVSTPVDGLLDVVTSGLNGYLSDDDNEIAEDICRIIVDEKHRFQLSLNAEKKFGEICDLAKYKATINNVYRS